MTDPADRPKGYRKRRTGEFICHCCRQKQEFCWSCPCGFMICKECFEENVDFYGYYRTHSTYLDHKYFVRRKLDVKLSLDSFVFESDAKVGHPVQSKNEFRMIHFIHIPHISSEILM